MTQFHFRTLVDYVAVSIVLVAAYAVIGSPVKLLLKATRTSIGRVVPAPIVGGVLVVVLSWYWALPYGGTKPVARILIVIGAIAVVAALCVVLARRSWSCWFSDDDLRSRLLLAAGCFAAVTLVFVVTDTQLFTRDHFTVMTQGNNDAPSYALISQHLLDHGPEEAGNIVGYHAGSRSLEFSGGACALLAGAASLTGFDVWKVMTPMMLVTVSLGAYAVALLVREVLGRERTALAGVASVLGFSVLYVAYLVAQWFFAQLVCMGLVVTVVATLFVAVRSRSRRDLVAAVGVVALLFAGGLFIYPHMAVVGAAVLLPIAAVDHSSMHGLVRRGATTAFAFVAALVLTVLVVPGLAVDAVETTEELAGVEAGWPFGAIYPTDMLGFQTSPAASRGAGTAFVSAVAVAAVAICGLVIWRRGRGDVALPLLAGGATVLGTYVVVYAKEGESYRQWKWLTFFLPVFVAFSVALVSAAIPLARHFADSWRPALVGLLGAYAAVVVGFAGNAGFPLNGSTAYPRVTLDQISLHGDARLKNLPALHINTSPYWETMWLAYFLRDVPVTLAQPTYYAVAAPSGEWWLERNDQPLAPGTSATPLNATYRLVRKH
ncbi:MAG TPA: hypothetical protein VF183_04375 [Acidimicrobiales bacterium]